MICFPCVIITINVRLKILLVTLLFFIVDYLFLEQFVKLLMVRYTYLVTWERYDLARIDFNKKISRFQYSIFFRWSHCIVGRYFFQNTFPFVQYGFAETGDDYFIN